MGDLTSRRLGRVRVSVPTSTANIGPGFDVFSAALERPRIYVEFEPARPGVRTITIDGAYAAEVNTDPDMHPAGKALSALAAKFGEPNGYSLTIRNDLPPSKGLGLSGAVAVGAVFCANRFFRLGLKGLSLVKIAANAEPAHHMDNVCASAFGGFNIVTRPPAGGDQAVMVLSPPRDLGLAILVPNVEKSSTEETRKLVPPEVSTVEHVRCTGLAAQISAAFATGDTETIIKRLPWDSIVEPARADGGAYGRGVDSNFLLEEKKILLRKFGVAETISGAGPSRALWYSLSEDRQRKRKDKVGVIGPAVNLVSERLGSLGYQIHSVFLTRPSRKGVIIV